MTELVLARLKTLEVFQSIVATAQRNAVRETCRSASMKLVEVVGLEPAGGLSTARNDASIRDLQDGLAERASEAPLLRRNRQRMQ